MLYRHWLDLNVHLLWCHNQPVAKGWVVTGPTLRFTQYTNSGAWLVREGWARVEHDGQTHTAEPGQWLIVKPGSRLMQPDSRVKEVAIDVGFKYLSHFSKWFKRHTGKSPQEMQRG